MKTQEFAGSTGETVSRRRGKSPKASRVSLASKNLYAWTPSPDMAVFHYSEVTVAHLAYTTVTHSLTAFSACGNAAHDRKPMLPTVINISATPRCNSVNADDNAHNEREVLGRKRLTTENHRRLSSV